MELDATKMNTEDLRAAYAELPPLPPPVTTWDEHRHALREQVANDYPARFLRWRPVRGTIAIRCDGYIQDELAELKADERDWAGVIADPGFGGNPHPCPDGASGTLIHQAYHLKQWMDRTSVKVSDLSSVFEIGAGYGAMALVLERLGFRGAYYVHDLPEMALLCQYYLANVETGIVPIFEIPDSADLIIAMHSWNEMPMNERGPVEAVEGGEYLIAYKEIYGEMDNSGYFKRIVTERPRLAWESWQPAYRKGLRWYLVGVC